MGRRVSGAITPLKHFKTGGRYCRSYLFGRVRFSQQQEVRHSVSFVDPSKLHGWPIFFWLGKYHKIPSYSYSHLLVITGYKWDYTFYKWGYKYL